MSDERNADEDQAAPIVNNKLFVQQMVISDIEDRMNFGIKKYGTALQAGNGRSMLFDAYEEVLDLVIYLRGCLEEEVEKIGSHIFDSGSTGLDKKCNHLFTQRDYGEICGLPLKHPVHRAGEL